MSYVAQAIIHAAGTHTAVCIAATHEILPASNFGWAVYTLTSPIVVTQIRNGLFSYRTSFNVAGITVLVGMLSTFVLVIPLIAIWRLRKVQLRMICTPRPGHATVGCADKRHATAHTT